LIYFFIDDRNYCFASFFKGVKSALLMYNVFTCKILNCMQQCCNDCMINTKQPQPGEKSSQEDVHMHNKLLVLFGVIIWPKKYNSNSNFQAFSRCLQEFSIGVTDFLVITSHVATVIYIYKPCILELELGFWHYHIREKRHLQL